MTKMHRNVIKDYLKPVARRMVAGWAKEISIGQTEIADLHPIGRPGFEISGR